MTAETRELLRRWTVAATAGFLLAAGFVHLFLFYENRFRSTTGKAYWIWRSNVFNKGKATAFFATRDFVVPPGREFVRIKICGDPEYMLFFNGHPIGGAHGTDKASLHVYDVTAIARPGMNRILVALRSANGVGGLMASVDFSPVLQNAIYTDKSWKLHDRWSDSLLVSDGRIGNLVQPKLLGRPPFGRWNYLTVERREIRSFPEELSAAVGRQSIRTALPRIVVRNGVAIATLRPVDAEVFDFGHREGHGALTDPGKGARMIRVKYANDPLELNGEGEIESFVMADGETTLIDPKFRRFRYMIVFRRGTEASIALPGAQSRSRS